MKVVLLDRDGTVIIDPPDERVDKLEKVRLFPDSIEALRYLAEHDFAIIFITNQAGIAEGRLDEAEFQTIQAKVLEMLAPSGVKVLETYLCPHAPGDSCACRKPKPTMLLQAIEKFNLRPDGLFMVGDRASDVLAGVNAGTKTILVKTANVPVESPEATYTAANLLDAVKHIVSSVEP